MLDGKSRKKSQAQMETAEKLRVVFCSRTEIGREKFPILLLTLASVNHLFIFVAHENCNRQKSIKIITICDRGIEMKICDQSNISKVKIIQ